jgi:hypothetical protein
MFWTQKNRRMRCVRVYVPRDQSRAGDFAPAGLGYVGTWGLSNLPLVWHTSCQHGVLLDQTITTIYRSFTLAKTIEETLKRCGPCGKQTIHMRNHSTTSGIMIVVHIFLILGTFGVWLALLIIWKVLNAKIGGWTCKECGK